MFISAKNDGVLNNLKGENLMKKRNFLKKSLAVIMVLIVMASLIACGGSSKEEQANGSSEELGSYEIRISACNSLDHPQTLGLGVMKEYVESKTGGKVKVKIYPNSQLGAEIESVEQVQNGTLEMATASIGPITTFDKKFAVLDIPFLFDNYQQAWATFDSQVGSDLMDTLEESGLKGLAYMENGFRHATNKVRPIYSIDDFKGLKIRTMEAPMHMANFSALGANPTPVPWSELYLAMSQKIVDGQENPLANIWELNMYEVQDYVSLTNHIYDAMPLVTNLKWFNSLPGEYQRIIEKGAILGQNYSRFINANRESLIVEELTKKGMKINSLEPDKLEAIKAVSLPVVAEKVKKEIGSDFVDAFIAGIDAVKADTVKSVK